MKNLGEVPLETFLSLVPDLEEEDRHLKVIVRTVPDDKPYKVKVGTNRVLNLKRSQDCACCGLKGTVVRVEDNAQGPHLNLYSENGTMMTGDHIIPKSAGGPLHLSNMQTLCFTCNHLKASRQVTLGQLRKMKAMYLRLLSLGMNRKTAKHRAMRYNFR